MSDYRTAAKSDGVTITPVVVPTQEPQTGSYYIVTDGTVYLTSGDLLTFKPANASQFKDYTQADTFRRHAGDRAVIQLHVVRVDVTTTFAYTDETFARATANATATPPEERR